MLCDIDCLKRDFQSHCWMPAILFMHACALCDMYGLKICLHNIEKERDLEKNGYRPSSGWAISLVCCKHSMHPFCSEKDRARLQMSSTRERLMKLLEVYLWFFLMKLASWLRLLQLATSKMLQARVQGYVWYCMMVGVRNRVCILKPSPSPSNQYRAGQEGQKLRANCVISQLEATSMQKGILDRPIKSCSSFLPLGGILWFWFLGRALVLQVITPLP